MIEDSLKRIADALERIALHQAQGVGAAPAAQGPATTPEQTPPPAADKPAGKGKKPAAPAPAPAPAAKPAASFLDDDNDEPAGPPLTKEDVKKALVAAQDRLAKKLGDAQEGTKAAMKILTEHGGGAETLKALADDQAVLRAVYTAATAAGV